MLLISAAETMVPPAKASVAGIAAGLIEIVTVEPAGVCGAMSHVNARATLEPPGITKGVSICKVIALAVEGSWPKAFVPVLSGVPRLPALRSEQFVRSSGVAPFITTSSGIAGITAPPCNWLPSKPIKASATPCAPAGAACGTLKTIPSPLAGLTAPVVPGCAGPYGATPVGETPKPAVPEPVVLVGAAGPYPVMEPYPEVDPPNCVV